MSICCSCPCGRRYRIADDLVGKRIRCKECGKIFTVPADATTESPMLAPAVDVPVREPMAARSEPKAQTTADSPPKKSPKPQGSAAEWVGQIISIILGILFVILIIHLFPGLFGRRSTSTNKPVPPTPYYQAYPPTDYYPSANFPPAYYAPPNNYSASPAPAASGGARPTCRMCDGSGVGKHCGYCGGVGRNNTGVKCSMCRGSGFQKCEACFGYQGIGFGRPSR